MQRPGWQNWKDKSDLTDKSEIIRFSDYNEDMTQEDPKRARGSFDFKTFGRILRIRAVGGWNDPTAQEFNKEYKQRISALPEGRWAAYFDLRRWGLVVPSALSVLNDLGSWTAPQGIGTHMFFFNGENIQESIIASILNVTEHDSFFFTTSHETVAWISKTDYYDGDPLPVVEAIY